MVIAHENFENIGIGPMTRFNVIGNTCLFPSLAQWKKQKMGKPKDIKKKVILSKTKF